MLAHTLTKKMNAPVHKHEITLNPYEACGVAEQIPYSRQCSENTFLCTEQNGE